MQLQQDDDGWYLMLHDGVVQLIQIDFRLGLFLSDALDKAQLYIETPCRLKHHEADVLLKPAETSSLGPALALFNARVMRIVIRKTGQLKVEFGDGYSLDVHPDDASEAWQIVCSTGLMLVCSPGGSVSLFQRTEKEV